MLYHGCPSPSYHSLSEQTKQTHAVIHSPSMFGTTSLASIHPSAHADVQPPHLLFRACLLYKSRSKIEAVQKLDLGEKWKNSCTTHTHPHITHPEPYTTSHACKQTTSPAKKQTPPSSPFCTRSNHHHAHALTSTLTAPSYRYRNR